MARKNMVSTGVTQLSLMEDYYPSTEIMVQRQHSLRARIARILEKEGLYNFAKLAEEALYHDEAWIMVKYGVPKLTLKGILNDVFGDATNYGETFESYLDKVRSVDNAKLWTPEGNTLFDDKKINQ